MQEPVILLQKKLYTVMQILACMLCIIVVRLFYLQVIQSFSFLQRGQKNYVRYQKVESLRGSIFDTKKRLLATNKPVTDIYWKGTGNTYLSQEQLHELAVIQAITQKDFNLDEIAYAEKKGKNILIIHDFSLEQLSCLVEELPACTNLDIQTHFKRYYPHDNLASHIVGYLSVMEESHEGKMGLEKVLEEQLHGTPGKKLCTINSYGKQVSQEEVALADPGQDIFTTIDLDMQMLAEKVFPEGESGVFVIMDPRNGALKALVSRPDFNPNLFLEPLNHEQWQEIKEKKPFLNRACNACYPPASLFKFITMAAGLELGLIQEHNMWYCSGKYMFANRPYHCAHQEGHGSLSTQEALVQSCNIPFFEIGKRIKIDSLADYARRFGLGQKTNVLFYEQAGLVPTSSWKREKKKEQWWPGETLSTAIGQSYLLVTPMQMLCMISSVCEGYLVKPRILEHEAIETKPLDISSSTLTFLKKALKKVTTHGTGRSLADIKDIDIYAKTGTAQTSDLSKKNLGKQFVEHGWLIIHATYKDRDPLACVILLENVGSSRVATAVAKLFLTQYGAAIKRADLS